jgi:hypothetical protein
MGAVMVSVLLGAGVAMAQATAPTAESGRGIVPVTGPSPGVAIPEPAKGDLIPAVAQGPTSTVQTPRKGTAGHVGATTTHGAKTTKVVHKPATKKTVKKATPPKHVAKTGATKPKHVAATKHQTPATHQATVGKPIPLTKPPSAVKGAAPAQPVLPRV